MYAAHLQALRRLLCFSVREAARWIPVTPERPSGVSPRAWQHWERGARAVPDEVAATMLQLVAWRARIVEELDETVIRRAQRERGPIPLTWYRSVRDWSAAGRAPIHWRPHCSAVAYVAAVRHPLVVVLPFDPAEYAAWLGPRRDHISLRWVYESTRRLPTAARARPVTTQHLGAARGEESDT